MGRSTCAVFAALGVALLAGGAHAQSTFGSFVGTVHDPSGAAIAGGIVTAKNTGTSAQRSALTNEKGDYVLVNLEAGSYELTIEAPGFQRSRFTAELAARDTVRVDANLTVAAQTSTVMVNASAEAVVTTDVSSISTAKTGRELVDLPVAIASRGSGSTSPISTLTTQAGVQTDASGNLSVGGAKPSIRSGSSRPV